MKTMGIYEVKTKISEICATVKETREAVLVTRRGQPLVRIEPVETVDNLESAVWKSRENFLCSHGPLKEELKLPERSEELFNNPLEE